MAWPDSQQREVEIVVQAAQVSGSGTLSSFPVLLTRANLPNEICSPTDGNRAQSDGGDIRAGTASGMGTRLPLEIVSFEYDSTDGAGDAVIEIWVARDVDGAADTSIWLGYNTSGTDTQPAVDAAFGREAVWSGASFISVWHMGNTGTSAVTDSAANGHDGTLTNGAAYVTGKVGSGVEFDGDNDFIELGTIATANPLQLNATNFTLSVWIEPDGVGDSFQRIIDKSDGGTAQNGWGFALGDNPVNGFEAYADSDVIEFGVGSTPADTWTRGTLVKTAAGAYSFYVNGSFVTSVTGQGNPPLVQTNARIGTWNHSTGREFNGVIDSITVADVAFSADWIATEYANQNTPSTFAVEGTPQNTASSFSQLLSATALGVAALSTATTVQQLLSATVVGSAVLVTATTVQQALSVTATATASLSRKIGKNLQATATAVASLSRATAKTFSATATATAALATGFITPQTISAAVSAAASLATKFTAKASPVMLALIHWLYRRRRRR